MNFSRRITIIAHYIFDQFVPPILRDNRWFMTFLFRIGLGKNLHYFINFKNKLGTISDEELSDYYRASASSHIQRQTDLNKECVELIQEKVITGDTVLDIACGSGYLANILSVKSNVTAADFVLNIDSNLDGGDIKWHEQRIESLEYPDSNFDTVVCAHTLEHTIDIQQAIAELRRVTKRQLIVVVPKQRPYQYTPDLHTHFFYYKWQLELLMRAGRAESTSNIKCELIGGDWVYIEQAD